MRGYKHKTESFFGTLFHSWGGDTPQEAIWAANDLIVMLNDIFDLKITDSFVFPESEEDDYGNTQLAEEIHQALLVVKEGKG